MYCLHSRADNSRHQPPKRAHAGSNGRVEQVRVVDFRWNVRRPQTGRAEGAAAGRHDIRVFLCIFVQEMDLLPSQTLLKFNWPHLSHLPSFVTPESKVEPSPAPAAAPKPAPAPKKDDKVCAAVPRSVPGCPEFPLFVAQPAPFFLFKLWNDFTNWSHFVILKRTMLLLVGMSISAYCGISLSCWTPTWFFHVFGMCLAGRVLFLGFLPPPLFVIFMQTFKSSESFCL